MILFEVEDPAADLNIITCLICLRYLLSIDELGLATEFFAILTERRVYWLRQINREVFTGWTNTYDIKLEVDDQVVQRFFCVCLPQTQYDALITAVEDAFRKYFG